MTTPSKKRHKPRESRRRRAVRKTLDDSWRHWKNPYPPVEQFSADQIEAIHNASLKVLSDTGIKVLSEEARKWFGDSGMLLSDDQVVRFDPELVMELIDKAPAMVDLQGRGENRNVLIGGSHVGVCTTGGTPNVSDLDGGRRPGSLAALEDFCKMAQTYEVIHIIGPFVEPQDVATNLRHLEMTRTALTMTDKIPFVFFRGTEAVADAYEMIRIANGKTKEEFESKPYCYSVANSNSPLQLDGLMCRGIIDSAKAGQLMILTPFTLAGAMAPVTLPGALVLQNAEALAGLVLAQIVKPGAPVCYGSFTSNVDMKSGSPAFGTPEYTKAAFASGQLARRYNLPLRSSGVTASNIPDAQSAYEMQMSLWGALMGGANLLLHGAGWLEGGLTASAEKFIIDVEMLQMFAELFKPLEVNADTLALDAITDVGHGGHFFGTQHTIDRFETAFYSPLVSDWSNYENWRDSGSLDAMQRANTIYKKVLAEYEAPGLESDRLEALNEFVVRRTAEGGADISR